MDSNERKSFGERVADERKARHWSQPQLAERVGVSVGTISATERGLSLPQPGNLAKLLRELGISMNGHLEPAEPTSQQTWGDWFEALPKDTRSTLFMLGLHFERFEPDERDRRIREITTAIVEDRL